VSSLFWIFGKSSKKSPYSAKVSSLLKSSGLYDDAHATIFIDAREGVLQKDFTLENG